MQEWYVPARRQKLRRAMRSRVPTREEMEGEGQLTCCVGVSGLPVAASAAVASEPDRGYVPPIITTTAWMVSIICHLRTTNKKVSLIVSSIPRISQAALSI